MWAKLIDKQKVTEIKKNPEKKDDEFSLYRYSIPSKENADYRSVTDETLGTLSLNMNKLPQLNEKDLESGNKIIRALFYVSLGNKEFLPIQEVANIDINENNENNGNEEELNKELPSDSHTMVNIFISPGKDNFKYVELKQYEYYFSTILFLTFLHL